MRLNKKVAIVTGATSGLGLAIAKDFSKEGAKVVLSDLDEKKGNQISKKIKNSIFIKCDVSNSSQVNELIEKTVKKFKKLDIIVNNAGIAVEKPLHKTTDQEWQKVIDINLTGVFYGTRAAANYMIKNKIKGSIINMTSILGENSFAGITSYCASKGGVNQITRNAALELGKTGIRVNAIAPGFILTNMTKEMLKNKKIKTLIESKTPMGHVGEPKDIAAAAVYLASDESKYNTGSVIYVDGGWNSN